MAMTATQAPDSVAPFTNEPINDFRDPADAAAMRSALETVKRNFGKSYPLVIDGRKIDTEKRIRSLNPADPEQVIGSVSAASKEQATQAIEAAARAFESWKHLGLPERAAYLFKAAQLLRERRFLYDALLVYEVGKSWVEADGDIAEAIDFLEFYAREALRFARPQPVVPLEGERNELIYIPLGVGAVIPPWNFAGAIMIGMTGAAIVTGNTVVLKPSSDSALIAAWFVDLLHEVGVPAGVVNFIPGSGSEIGDLRVRKKSGCASTSSRQSRSPDRSGSSASSRRWAGKTRSSSPPTPIWMRRSRASRSLHSVFRVRNVPRVRVRSSTKRSMTSSSIASGNAWARSPSVIRPTRPTTWDRS
jgi:1-pyrroline-5-carboxylate dehydrogenase